MQPIRSIPYPVKQKKNELAVKIVTNLIKKTEQDGRELWKAILD